MTAGEALARQDDGRSVRPGVGVAGGSDLVGIGGADRPDLVGGAGDGGARRPEPAGGDGDGGDGVAGRPDLAAAVGGCVAGTSSRYSSDSG